MDISIKVSKEYCITAIQYCLSLNEPAKNKKDFKEQLACYITYFGDRYIDSHNEVFYNYKSKAIEIVEKYFKK